MSKPAFPQYIISNGGAHVDGGMTLRDYFAAHATEDDICIALDSIEKVVSVSDLGNGVKATKRVYPDNARQLARYIHADAMLKARGEK
jgi:hypothetical protein